MGETHRRNERSNKCIHGTAFKTENLKRTEKSRSNETLEDSIKKNLNATGCADKNEFSWLRIVSIKDSCIKDIGFFIS